MKSCNFVFLLLLISTPFLFAQDNRFRLPKVLQKSYFEVNVGSINYNFGKSQFESLPDYEFQVVEVPHTALRLVLFGYKFNNYFSAQISYMRPIYWVNYQYNINESSQKSSVWMNIAGLTGKAQFPITKNVSLFGEFGLGIITRHGAVSYDGAVIVKDANYSSYLLGGGVKYALNNRFDIHLSSIYSPQKSDVKQPATTFFAAGFTYNLHPLTEDKIQTSKKSDFIHPKHLFQVGYSSLIFGYGINNYLSDIPVFWGGDSQVKQGLTFNYRRNIYHTAKYFSLDLGVGAAFFQSNENKEFFYTLAAYPVFRFNFLHTKPLDMYAYYSIAGPAFISKTIIDGFDGGEKFTFQDYMGVGFFMGERRNYNLEFNIGHFSNGNLFPQNSAVKIPFSINLGYAF